MAAWRAGLSRVTFARSISMTTPAGAAAAASQPPIKPPIQVYGVEGRYAHAVFSAASRSKSLEKVENELKDFKRLLAESSAVSEFINNPTIRKQQKKDILNDVLKKKAYSTLTVNLFGALAENNRLPKVPGVIKAFSTIMSAYRGEVTCIVTTAKPLNEKNVKEVEGVLQGFLTKGQSLNVEYKTDPALIGGMIVDIGDKYVDMSTATKVRKIVEAIEQGL